MKTVTQPKVLADLVARLEALRPDTPRRWGTLTPGEMLCHLGDAAASVLSRRDSRPAQQRRLIKWIALNSPLPWPRGVKTPPQVDPRAGGSKPGDFERDRARAIEGLRALAASPATAFAPTHGMFGAMSAQDWHRWAHRHTDHHLRQFGL